LTATEGNVQKVRPPLLGERRSGLLLHPTSLPGPHGSGDFGPEAVKFVDFLASTGQSWWQMLPVGPAGFGNSPYSALSAFAGNPLLISLDWLVEDGLLDRHGLEEAARLQNLPRDHVDYGRVIHHRGQRLKAAFEAFQRMGQGGGEVSKEAFTAFCERERVWLDDFALYAALKARQGGKQWTLWSPELVRREPAALGRARRDLAEEVRFHQFEQWMFERHVRRLRAHAHSQGIGIIGDVPIFVAHDSADVWAHPEVFHLDADGQPTVVAGVPPDYFSKTGQRWGNPLYRWSALKERGFDWWITRMQKTLERFDILRLDHFIGFHRYWEIQGTCPTAVDGQWVLGPGAAFFETVRERLGDLPLIAEDLGLVTPEVTALREQFGLPGIKVLQFAFSADIYAPDFLPHNYVRNSVVYTGTHDNNTSVGWYTEGPGESTRTPEQVELERHAAREYLAADGNQIHWDMIRAVEGSVASLCIIPVQDLLGLGPEARMNRPGRADGNWEWRVPEHSLQGDVARRLGDLTRVFYRRPPAPTVLLDKKP
jgi:4-alpha-glucanotransferase